MSFTSDESTGWMSLIVRTVNRLHEWFKRALSARPVVVGLIPDGLSHLFLVSGIFALFFAFVGPENASGLSFIASLAMWFALSLLTFAALFEFSRILSSKQIKFSWAWAVLPATGVTAVSSVVMEALIPELNDQKPTLMGYILEIPDDFMIILPQVFVISAIYHWATEKIAPAAVTHVRNAPMAEERKQFIKKLPPKIGWEIIAVSSEANYLRVYTRLGDAMILGSLTDAEKALADLPMIRIHRSHSVNGHHVTDMTSKEATLETGLTLPLSRRRATEAKDAWRLCRLPAEGDGPSPLASFADAKG